MRQQAGGWRIRRIGWMLACSIGLALASAAVQAQAGFTLLSETLGHARAVQAAGHAQE